MRIKNSLFILILIVLLLFLSICKETVSATDILASGTSGDLSWILYDNGTLEFSGDGKMGDYGSGSATYPPYYSYRESICRITFNGAPENIGRWAFVHLNKVVQITIPNSVVSIGFQAFTGCDSLLSVALPNNMTTIGDSAFWGCTNLKYVTIPNSVIIIENEAFYGCDNLEEVIIPESVTTIGDTVFPAYRLTSLTIPSTVRKIGENAVYGYGSSLNIYYGGTRDKQLCSYKFALDDNGEIDPFSFAIACDSGYYELGDISEDDVVTIYSNSKGTISRIEVGTKTVEGMVTDVRTSGVACVWINGVKYRLSADTPYPINEFNLLKENETEAVFFLDYNGEIYDFYESVGNTSSYGIFLGVIEEDGNKNVSVLRRNGQTAMYPLSADVSLAIEQGSLVQYTIDPDGTIVGMTVADGSGGNGQFDRNGIFENHLANSDTVTFVFDGSEQDLSDWSNYRIISIDELQDSAFDSITYFNEEGKLTAILIKGYRK